MKNHFHRKKLQLALQRYSVSGDKNNKEANQPSSIDLLDHNWVTRKSAAFITLKSLICSHSYC